MPSFRSRPGETWSLAESETEARESKENPHLGYNLPSGIPGKKACSRLPSVCMHEWARHTHVNTGPHTACLYK